MMNDFEVYQKYLALKLHFTTDNYNYFTYNGKVSATPKSFESRKDRYQFSKLSKKLSDKQILEFLVSNFIDNKTWIGDFNSKTWQSYKKTIQSLEYIFSNDMEKLLTLTNDFDILFKVSNGNHPKLLKAYLGKKITLETLIILQKLLEYKKQFDLEISEKFIWPKISLLIEKYEPFLQIENKSYKTILLTKIREHNNG